MRALLLSCLLLSACAKRPFHTDCRITEDHAACTFTNLRLLPHKGCGHVVMTRKMPTGEKPGPKDVSESGPVCSGLLMPRSSTSIPVEYFSVDLVRLCGDDWEAACVPSFVWD